MNGTVFVESGKSEFEDCRFCVIGDDQQILYMSDFITNATRPFDIRVDVSGMKTLSIGYTGYLKSMYGAQHIMFSNAKLNPSEVS